MQDNTWQHAIPGSQVPVIWLQTRSKYLALLTPGTHFSSSDDIYVQDFPPALLGPSTALGREYLKVLSAAFFGSYLGDRQSRNAYRPYLNASYARTLSQDPLQLYLIQSLTPTQLERDYGRPLPNPVIPHPLQQNKAASIIDCFLQAPGFPARS